MLMVIAAMELELSCLRRELKSCRAEQVNIQVIGVGRERTQSSISRILNSRQWHNGDRLLMLGFAGGLDPVLKCGDLLVPTHYYAESGDSIVANSEMWKLARLSAIESELTVVQGNSLTVDHLITTPEDKKTLYQQHQVGSVNMEDYWASEVANDAKVPFLSARSVLDPAAQGLPNYVLGLSGHPAKAAFRVMSKPWRAPAMLAMAGMINKAQFSLGQFGMAFIKNELSATER